MSQKLEKYLELHTTPPTKVLKELYRQTHLKTVYPRMISGHVQGRFLGLISQMINPERILEVGTFTGYSAIELAGGLKNGGKLITIEANEEFESLILDFVKKAGFEKQIELVIGDAKTIIPALDGTFDLIFLDADKAGYPGYYPMLKEKLRSGGFLIADNVLWGMKVLAEESTDQETLAIIAFNKLIADDKDVEQVILPMRDGLMIVRKLV
ncbi:MAG: class I SAM-dependent methyltransferase [Bacteroidetes bacterium]|jgi:caffeoyl-CoA O-methyltransferase|nr:class I SAM-dependent methyltransferase [Bacteroidota bacterium]